MQHTVSITIGASDWATDTESERVDCPGVMFTTEDDCNACGRSFGEIVDDGDLVLDLLSPPCQNYSVAVARRRR